MENRKIMILDFDGVVVNNTHLGYQKVSQILGELKLPAVPVELIRKHWGKRADELGNILCSYHCSATSDNIGYFQKRVKEININAVLDMNLCRSLVRLSNSGFLTGILTNRDKEDLYKHAGEIGLDLDIFDYTQTTDDYHRYKPDGEVFWPLLQWAHEIDRYTAENIIYFGDTIRNDYQAVKNARLQGQSIRFVGVCSGANTYEEFLAAGLDQPSIVESHEKLSDYLNQLADCR